MEYKKENNIRTEVLTNVNANTNEKEYSEVIHVTEIKRENSPFSSNFIGIEPNHIQFENVLIKVEREDQFFEENVEESFNKPLANQDEIRSVVSQNDFTLSASAIKKESENQDVKEHFHARFDNILETFDSENGDMEIKVEENYDKSLYLKTDFNDPLTNQYETKIDIVDNNIEESSEKEHVIPLENKNETEKDMNSWLTAIKDESTSKSSKLQDIDKQKIKTRKCHSISKQFKCNICKKKFSFSTNLNHHMKIHTEEKMYECSVCQKKFTRSSNLKEHIKIHSDGKPYECDVCQKRFFKNILLKRHMKNHTGEKQHECSVCLKKFIQLSNLKQHMKIHTGEKPHECDVCRKKFTQLSHLKKHIKIHTGEKSHECSVCQKKFSDPFSLSRHMKCHTVQISPYNVVQNKERENLNCEKPIEESVDNLLVSPAEIKIDVSQDDVKLPTSVIKKENEHEDFEEHLKKKFDNILETYGSENADMATKVEESNDYSSYLENCFDSPLTNLDEINDIESGNDKNKSQYQNEQIEEFSIKDNVIPQKDQDEDKTDKETILFQKSLEGQKQQQKCNIVNQQVKIVNKHECTICKKNYFHASSLISHMKIHIGGKQFECSTCQKKFTWLSNLRVHMKIHTGEKPYECSVCQKKFSQSCNLKQHMKMHTGERSYECSVCQKKYIFSSNMRVHEKSHCKKST